MSSSASTASTVGGGRYLGSPDKFELRPHIQQGVAISGAGLPEANGTIAYYPVSLIAYYPVSLLLYTYLDREGRRWGVQKQSMLVDFAGDSVDHYLIGSLSYDAAVPF